MTITKRCVVITAAALALTSFALEVVAFSSRLTAPEYIGMMTMKPAHAFRHYQAGNLPPPVTTTATTTTTTTTALSMGATGGWGIGNSRELTPEEFVGGGRAGERRAGSVFEGYQMRDRGEFMRNVQHDKDAMKQAELEELLGVASMAGINVKDPSTRLHKFDEDAVSEPDDDDIDLSV